MAMITKELQEIFLAAFQEARRRRHEYLSLEHFLHAYSSEESGRALLEACDVRVETLRQELETFFHEKLETLPEGVVRDPEQTLAFQRVWQRAGLHVQSAGKQEIDSGSLLAALFYERDSYAVFLLEKQGLNRLDVLNYLSHGIGKIRESEGEEREEAEGALERTETAEGGKAAPDALKRFTVNLNEQAKRGKIDPLIGRDTEMERTVQILCRRRKNNPLYVGEAGVGKTALAEGLALRIVQGHVPLALRHATLYSLDLGSLLAGTKFRGEFEQRLKSVIAALRAIPQSILFIDEIHTIVGAGAVNGGSMDAGSLLKPALASGELRCVGSTTYAEYKAVLEKDRALARRFQQVEVHEPTVEQTYQILKGLKVQYETHHGVRYTDAALRAAAELSGRYILDRCLPDKAIDVIDEVGAAMHLGGTHRRVVRPTQVEAVVARMARVPVHRVTLQDRARLQLLEHELKKRIYGQAEAVDQLVTAIKLSRAGLRPPDKTIGNFLFSGPTGVGKTELAKQLADVLGLTLLRFDMSEYMEKHTVSRLIGAPPGYVGFDQGGLLTDAVRRTPHAVLVLDEIEKAHPDVYNLLLQVMDYATLTDNNGRKADFRNIILIMTTNAGARELLSPGIGFGSAASSQPDKGAIERTFSPEFRNRLDAWISFSPLSEEIILRIVDKLIAELSAQLLLKKVRLSISPEARTWLVKHGYSAQYGARPLTRLIQEHIKKPLADLMLFGALQQGGAAHVELHGEGLVVKTETVSEQKPLFASTSAALTTT